MNYLEQELFEFVKRFPFSTPEFFQDRIVNKHKVMTKDEFEEAYKSLMRQQLIYEPRPGRVDLTRGRRVFTAEGDAKRHGKAVKLKFPKPKLYKSKAKLITRKHVEGYQCRACGKWVKREWKLRRLRKCPKCGRKTYYGKPALEPVTKKYQRATRYFRTLLKYVDPQRVGRHDITVASWPPLPPGPEAVREIEKPKRKHVKREEYRGSEKAKAAGKQSWEKRLEHGWKPKQKLIPPKIIIKGKVKLTATQIAGYKAHASRNGRVLVGFYKDEEGKVRPVTKSIRELKRAKVVKHPRALRPVRPRTQIALRPSSEERGIFIIPKKKHARKSLRKRH